MKTKYIIFVVLLVIVFASLIVYFVNNQKTDLKLKCCKECLYGASYDVRGMDISFKPC